jgi:hypothetical protein
MKRLSLTMLMGVILLSCQRKEKGVEPILYSPMERTAVYHPTFVWESTGDMYHLQVSGDSSFASTVINEEDLTDTAFTPEDTLQEARYYWRVRAKLDTWGEWSNVGSFFVVVSPPGLIFPPDADTVKFPTLVWNATEGADNYHLYVYQGDIAAGVSILDTILPDTFYVITDTLDPATYRWSVRAVIGEAEIPYPDTHRFVTYTLDESFYPVGPNYVWEYMRVYSSWSGYGGSDFSGDTSYYSIEITEFVAYGDSIYAAVDRQWYDIGSEFLYKNDSIYHHYSEWEEGFAIRLFPEDGDKTGYEGFPEIHKESDSTFWVGWKPVGGFGEDEWVYMYREKGRGLIFFDEGWEVIYHGDPTQSHGWSCDHTLINLDKGE